MKITPQELQKVQNLTFDETYFRIKSYYSKFIVGWYNLTYSQKENYIFGNNRQSDIDYVDKSKITIDSLTNNPSLTDAIELARSVIYRDLEYSYHDIDNHDIKMGVYAHYIINSFNGGILFD